MKLLNYTLKYLSLALLLVISVWAVLFFFNITDELKDSLDDGLENNKMLVIKKVEKDTLTIIKSGFSDHNYSIREVSESHGLKFIDSYKDTLMYTLNENDFEPFRMLTSVFNHQGKYYELKVVSSTVEEDDLIEDILYSMIWLYALIIGSIILINNIILKKIWQPFYLLINRLKSFRLDKDEKILTKKSSIKEFEELNQSVNQLIEQSVKTYGSQKQFIENAAHELQTPLAISLNRLELLAENEDLSEEHLSSIAQVIQTLQRLTRLNKSLLLLSKIENNQFGSVELISINEILKHLLEEFNDLAEIKLVKIDFIESGKLEYNMNKELAAILFSNLIKNALVHNVSNGLLNVYIDEKSVKISNSGQQQALQQDVIFKRFFKGSSDNSSTGLGLSIVDAIAKSYDFQIHYSFDGLHHIGVYFK